jgi:hypothetical protein
MNCILNEATFRVGKEVVDCCEIDLWHPSHDDRGERGASVKVLPWHPEMIEELAVASGMTGDNGGGDDWANQIKAFDIVCSVGSDSMHFINDPEIERALDIWREKDNMDDISEPSYFTQWDQSLNGTTWVTDGNPQNLDPVLLTPEMLQQTDKLNILWDEQCGELIHDQLATLEVVAVGPNHGVAKCAYGGVFLTKGTLTFLQRVFDAGNVGDKFRCWITFDGTRKYPWRTVVNGVVSYEYQDLRVNY